jgi:hypothetical protein
MVTATIGSSINSPGATVTETPGNIVGGKGRGAESVVRNLLVQIEWLLLIT